MIALLDGDIYCYRVGYTSNEIDFNLARYRIDESIQNTLNDVKADSFYIYLSDSGGNFRLQYCPEYKANRTQPKPKWLEDLKEHLIVNWKASISFGQEADDALGITQCYYMQKTLDPYASTICSIDKDLFQIPGNHYNYVKKEFTYMNSFPALKWFYTQLLTGDVVDNIKGVEGIGKAKAAKILEKAVSEESLFGAVRETYEKFYGEEGIPLMLKYGRVLKIRQQEEELWNFPTLDIQVL